MSSAQILEFFRGNLEDGATHRIPPLTGADVARYAAAAGLDRKTVHGDKLLLRKKWRVLVEGWALRERQHESNPDRADTSGSGELIALDGRRWTYSQYTGYGTSGGSARPVAEASDTYDVLDLHKMLVFGGITLRKVRRDLDESARLRRSEEEKRNRLRDEEARYRKGM